MKVAMTHPFCWPYVRRGTERNIEILSDWLAGRNHEVTLVSSREGAPGVEKNGLRTRILKSPISSPILEKLHIYPQHTFFFTSYGALRSLDADVLHSFFYTDALAGSLALRSHGCRTVLQLNGIAIPGISTRRFPPEAWMLRKAIERADEFIVCSSFIQQLAERWYGRRPKVVFPPVAFEQWPLGPGADPDNPVLLAVGDFDVRRKGVRVLTRAFQLLKDRVPRAVLKISGRLSDPNAAEALADCTPAVRNDVQLLGLGRAEDLPGLYQTATIAVLPSMWEPSAGALLEALASGTPFVGTNHGGIPEFLTPEVGVLFDPLTEGEETHNAAGLCEAMLKGLELSRKPGVREDCRRHAWNFSAEALGPEYERLYVG